MNDTAPASTLIDFTDQPGRIVALDYFGAIRDVLVLSTAGSEITVLYGTRPVTVPATLPATLLQDPQAVLTVAQQATQWVARTYQEYTAAAERQAGQIRSLRTELDDTRTELDDARTSHRSTLADIRGYAVNRHRAGEICRSGLNAFLTHFGLDTYRRQHQVRFTVTGTLSVDVDDERSLDGTEHDVRGYLRVDTGQVDNVVEDSLEVTVTAQASELTD